MKREAMLYKQLEDKQVQCYLCSHKCKIADSKFGLCGVRQNIEGTLYTLVYGEAVAASVDPIEKKPLYHFLPGSHSYSIATIGCNFKCDFCQNWHISQISKKDTVSSTNPKLSPEIILSNAKKNDCDSISYTYTEPTIYFEYAYDTAKLAKQNGLYNVFVTNGYMSKKALDTIRPYLDAANVDLKSFNEDYYKTHCQARLAPVLESITYMKNLNIWIEVTTLIVPGENDSIAELNNIAKFIADIDKDIPWHISRFYPNYKFTKNSPTSIDILRKTKEIGKSQGLRYVYLGNVLENVDTYCYQCQQLLIKRNHFAVTKDNMPQGKCRACNTEIAGIFS